MKVIRVLKPTKYNVYIGKNSTYHLLERYTFDKVLVVADSKLEEMDINNVVNAFPNSYLLKIEASEENKSLASFKVIVDELIKNNFGKSDYLVAFGGGVICDLVGYVASSYKRGIKYISVPTSMLAMVDASVGSKVAINYANIKNALGSFYSPEMVIIDPYYLHSLPKRHFNNGLMEAFKMGLTINKDILDATNKQDYEEVIYQSILAKTNIVNTDPFDENIRHVLNFAHTLAHGIEMVDNDILHGEAVGASMLYFIENDSLKREVKEIVAKYIDLAKINDVIKNNKDMIIEKIKNDKKVFNSNDYFIKEVFLNNLDDYCFKDIKLSDYEVIINE